MELLKGKVSPWKQLYHKWRANRNVPFRSKFFVGYDLDGNTFWEFKNHNNPFKMRRIVEYRLQNLNYVDYKAPPQWIQWLRFTRPHAPTLDELAADKLRQARLKGLVEAVEEKWRSIPLKAETDSPKSTPQFMPKDHTILHSKQPFDKFAPAPASDERLSNSTPIKVQSRK